MGARPSKSERHRRIIAELKANPTVRISTLAQEFAVSTETVRRDIDELSERGLVSRTYGGAAVTSMSREPALEVRGDLMVAERQQIARLAVARIEPGEVIMLDSGATTVHLARRLAIEGQEATVITNGIGILAALADCARIRVILCPGTYVRGEQGVYGPETADFLRRFHANRAVIGSGGLTVDGACDVDSAAVWVKRAMLERADRRCLMLDHAKFDQRLLEVVAPLSDLDELLTDAPPPPKLGAALKRAGVEVLVA